MAWVHKFLLQKVIFVTMQNNLVYVLQGIADQTFPEIPWQFWKCLRFNSLPRHFCKYLGNYRNENLMVLNKRCSNSGRLQNNRKN